MAAVSRARRGQMFKACLRALVELGGEARAQEAFAAAAPGLQLTDYELERYEKTGYVRWQSLMHFASVGATKAGYLRKGDGKWYVTPEGEAALSLPDEDLFISMRDAYRVWKSKRPVESKSALDADEDASDDGAVDQPAFVQAQEAARSEIEERINSLDPYEFQDLVAELLKGMGYHVPFVARKGRDGGIDITAYTDPLGTRAPRIRVQVKHRNERGKVGGPDVRNFESAIRTDGDMGLIVSSSGFTPDADSEIRASRLHIERMDLDRLITLWQDHYERISQKGRQMLPLARLFFLAPVEE